MKKVANFAVLDIEFYGYEVIYKIKEIIMKNQIDLKLIRESGL